MATKAQERRSRSPSPVYTECQAYIRRIRSAPKKRYAQEYYRHLFLGVELPDAREAGLSYMAAQAVRMRLEELTSR